MRQTELDVANNVGVLDRLVAGGPVDDRVVVWVARLAGGLADIVTGRVELVIAVGYDPKRLAGEACPLPDDAAGLRQEWRAVVVENLVADRFLADAVDGVWVDDLPAAARLVAVICSAFLRGAQEGLLRVEAVTVRVGRGANRII